MSTYFSFFRATCCLKGLRMSPLYILSDFQQIIFNRSEWLLVRVQLQSLKLQISFLLRARSSLTFRKLHCVKCVQIQSYFWSVFSCIRTEYGKIRTRKNHVLGHFSRSAIEFGFTLKRVRDMIRTYSHKNRFFGFYKFLISQYLH